MEIRWGARQSGKTTWLMDVVPQTAIIFVPTQALARRWLKLGYKVCYHIHDVLGTEQDVAIDDYDMLFRRGTFLLHQYPNIRWITFTPPDYAVTEKHPLYRLSRIGTKLESRMDEHWQNILKDQLTEMAFQTTILGKFLVMRYE